MKDKPSISHVELIQRARRLRSSMTAAELKLWAELNNKQMGGIKFRRQHPIGKYIVDFYAPQRKLIIEVDGGTHLEQEEYDAIRTSYLNRKGYQVIRFSNLDIYQNLAEVLDQIRTACHLPFSDQE